MLGTIETIGVIQLRLSAVREAIQARRAMSLKARQELKSRFGATRYSRGRPLAMIVRHLMRCDELSRQFRVVERDSSVTRQVNVEDSYGRKAGTVNIPLVLSSKLPAPRVHKELVTGEKRESYSVKAVVPHPTKEAIDAIRQHRDLFDWIEVWWVPNDVLIEKLPDPDPIVVGAVSINRDKTYYFELHRWVDETVEVAWWSKEGY